MLELIGSVLKRADDHSVRCKVNLEDTGNIALHLHSWRKHFFLLLVGSAANDVFFAFFQRNVTQTGQEVFENHFGGEDVLREPDHSATRNGGQCGLFEILHFKHDADVGRNRQTFTVGQRQKFVFIQDGVEILDRIDITVKNNPLPFVNFTTDIFDDFSQNVSEQSVGPLASVWIKNTLRGFFGNGFRVDNMSHTFGTYLPIRFPLD